MPPEVLLGHTVSPQGDIWSLGVTAYVMACGRFPFANQDMIVESQLEFPAYPQLSNETREVIAAMLRKDPSIRPSAAELLRTPSFVVLTQRIRDQLAN